MSDLCVVAEKYVVLVSCVQTNDHKVVVFCDVVTAEVIVLSSVILC